MSVITRWQTHIYSFMFILLGCCGLIYSLFLGSEVNGYIMLFSLVCMFSGAALLWQNIDMVLSKSDKGALEAIRVTRRCFFFKEREKLTNIIPASLQIIQKRIRKMNSVHSFNSYELNLVSKDGARINMLNTGRLARVEQLAKQVKEFSGLDIELVEEIVELDAK